MVGDDPEVLACVCVCVCVCGSVGRCACVSTYTVCTYVKKPEIRSVWPPKSNFFKPLLSSLRSIAPDSSRSNLSYSKSIRFCRSCSEVKPRRPFSKGSRGPFTYMVHAGLCANQSPDAYVKHMGSHVGTLQEHLSHWPVPDQVCPALPFPSPARPPLPPSSLAFPVQQ